MTDWAPLLDHLTAGPRENGTPALDETAAWLAVETLEWTAHPWRLRVAGVMALALGIA